MRKLLFIFFLSFWLNSSLLLGQDFIVDIQHYNTEDKLSHNNIQCIHQDSRGLIWLGTMYGLNRFDGHSFKWYTKEKHGLQNNVINYIYEDFEGWMWLICTKSRGKHNILSIDLFNPITEEVITFEDKFGESLPFTIKDINGFIASPAGSLAIVTEQEQLITYAEEKDFEVHKLNLYPIELAAFSMHGTLWASIRKNENNLRDVLVEIDLEGNVLNRYEHDFPFQYNYIAGVDEADNFWYLLKHWENDRYEEKRNGKLFKIDINGIEEEVILGEIDSPAATVNLDMPIHGNEHGIWINPRSGNFWLYGRGSFQGFDFTTGWYQDLGENQKELVQPNVVHFDGHGRTWVGTTLGLVVIEVNKNPFKSLAYDATNKNTLAFRGITEDKDGNIWSCIDRGAGWIGYFKRDKDQITTEIYSKDKEEWGNGYKYGIYSDSKGFVWFGSRRDSVLTKLNPIDLSFESFPYSIPGKGRTNIWSFYEDKNGLLWLGTDKGRIAYLSKDNDVVFLPEMEGLSAKGGCIYQFFEDKKGNTWITTDNGLYLLNIETKEVQPYQIEGLSFLKNGIYHVHLDNDGSFWMGTNGMGLINWQPETTEYQRFTRADGLSDNTIYGVYEDAQNKLWLPSNLGIIQFNKNTHRSQAYLEKDGISGHEFNRASHFKSKDGTLFFGGVNGITAFHPKDVRADSSFWEVPLVISGFQQFVGDEQLLVDKTAELLENPNITLAPNDPFFRIEFGLLTYEDVDKIQYAYKIEGQDLGWTYQKENYIRLSRLPYGEHVLRIKGQASNGAWSPNELAVKIRAVKPFYLQTWFLILSVLGFFASIFTFNRYRTIRLKRQKAALELEVEKRTKTISEQAEQLKSLEKLKSRFFANVSHELRTPLTLMLGPISKLKKGSLPKEKAQKLIDFLQNNSMHLLKLVNEILDLSKLESNRLEIQESNINLYDFLNQIIIQFQTLGENDASDLFFEYQLDRDLNISLDAGKFEKILHNFLSNALKFTPIDGRIEVAATEKEAQILIKIKDTGAGIHPKDLPHVFDRFYQSKQADAPVQGGTGIGLSMCKELAELLGGGVWAESELGLGSVFYFEFPKKVAGSKLQIAGLDSNSESKFLQIENVPTIKKQKPELPAETKLASSKQQLTTILIVEDNPELREYLEVLLSDNYNIITAENGKTGYDCLLQTEDCQLIISDLMMPIMDGLQFLEKVKSNDKFRHIPFIMLTARADMRVKLKALRIGVDDYLTKPFVEEELLTRVDNLLANYSERLAVHSEKENGRELALDKPVIGAVDLEWLEKVESLYLKYMNDSRLSTDFIAEKVFLSGRQFHRRLKQLTGLSPNQYLREIRLNQARQHLEIGKFATVRETCLAVGFSDVRYFAKIYRERFGRSPSLSIRA